MVLFKSKETRTSSRHQNQAKQRDCHMCCFLGGNRSRVARGNRSGLWNVIVPFYCDKKLKPDLVLALSLLLLLPLLLCVSPTVILFKVSYATKINVHSTWYGSALLGWELFKNSKLGIISMCNICFDSLFVKLFSLKLFSQILLSSIRSLFKRVLLS